MPCRDYESDNWRSVDNSAELTKLKKQADMLARIACKAMNTLEENQIEDLLLLKDDEVRNWWLKHKEADRKERERVAERERRAKAKAEALSKLTDEEKELLGLATAKKSAKAKVVNIDIEALHDQLIYEWEKVLESKDDI